MTQVRWWGRLWLVGAAAASVGCASGPRGPDPLAWQFGASESDQFAVYREVMASPGRAAALADRLQQQAAQAGLAAGASQAGAGASSVQPTSALWAMVRGLSARARDGHRLVSADQPHLALARTVLDAPTEQALRSLPWALGEALQVQLLAMQEAQHWLDGALDQVPEEFTRQALLSGRLDGAQVAHGAAKVDLPGLAQGMQVLIDATARLKAVVEALARAQQLPAVRWQHRTPWGWVHVDTTGASLSLAPEDVWLWLKVGGDDQYDLDAFHGPSDRRAVRVLLDTGGDDVYSATQAGADAAAGVLGLSVLWDGQGHDRWQCSRWCQGAGWLGAGVLVNEGGGQDEFSAQTQAQAYAVGGLALLASNMGVVMGVKGVSGSGDVADGNTVYSALSDAQGSAGPSGVALLVDAVGDDRYALAPLPLVAASAQLPDRNSSMGQGAGRGWWGRSGHDALSTAGGVGVLVDLQGDDHYVAQVFAQGAGYHEGLGVLVDAGGRNRFEAAWYALGAAAHGAAGVMVASGSGDDVYSVSHVTALGAGHDAALGWFEDRGGHDVYALSDVGLGVGLEGGVGVFVDTQGHNCFAVGSGLQRVKGQSFWLSTKPRRQLREGVGVFRVGDLEERCESNR